jgi:hypothetical protein
MGQKLAEFLNILFGFRKTIIMVLLFAVGIVFRLMNLVNGSEFVDLLKSTSVAFFAANGLEHITTTVKEYINSKGQKVDQVDSNESADGQSGGAQ